MRVLASSRYQSSPRPFFGHLAAQLAVGLPNNRRPKTLGKSHTEHTILRLGASIDRGPMALNQIRNNWPIGGVILPRSGRNRRWPNRLIRYH
jgi:hypothetical protein